MPEWVGSGEGLGVAALASTATWRKAPPSQQHQYREGGVGQREHPERRFVVDEPLEPVFDEAPFVPACARLDPEPGLQCRERTELPQPGLSNDEANSCQMRQAEPPLVDPAPVQPVSCHNHDKAAHHEEHDSEVEDKHCIS